MTSNNTRTSKTATVVLTGLFFVLGMFAQTNPQPKQLSDAAKDFSKEYDSCLAKPDAAAGQTNAMNDCTVAEYERQDARLNKAYKKLVAKLKGEATDDSTAHRIADIRNVQLAWIKYLTAKCSFTPFEGGTEAPLWSNSCRLAMTKERADELENMLEW